MTDFVEKYVNLNNDAVTSTIYRLRDGSWAGAVLGGDLHYRSTRKELCNVLKIAYGKRAKFELPCHAYLN